VLIGLSVRRLFCDSPGCGRRTFAEQVEGLTVRFQRRSPLLQHLAALPWTQPCHPLSRNPSHRTRGRAILRCDAHAYKSVPGISINVEFDADPDSKLAGTV